MGEKQSEVMLGGLSCFLLIIYLPWIVLDFYFADSDSPCLTQEITEYPNISFTLDTWLRVQGGYLLFFWAVTVILACISCAAPMEGVDHNIANYYVALGFPWTIVGGLMFWGDLDPSGTCDTHLTNYMYVNLILGCFAVTACCQCCVVIELALRGDVAPAPEKFSKMEDDGTENESSSAL